MNYSLDILEKGFSELEIAITDKQKEQFIKYYEMLIETNKVMNLTAITEYNEVMVKHFIDSVLVVKQVDLNKIQSFVDVGTGAGFPGIPLKIMFPHLKVTLLDSLNKRLKFLDGVIRELGLEDVELVHGRAEDLGHRVEHREKYDLCVSRAVANLATLSEYCMPFVRKGGLFVSYKAADSQEEINEAKKAIGVLGGKITDLKECALPCSDMKRRFVIIEKVNITNKRYPRKAGMPSKEPIK